MAKSQDITFVPVIEGYRAFRGDPEDGDLVCNLATRHFQGMVKNGAQIYEPLPRKQWMLHWCNPQVPMALHDAVTAALPETA